MGTKYAKGRALEYECKRVLEELGYVVIRSAGSHTPADLVACRNGKFAFIQVQADSHLPRQKESALKAFAKRAGAVAYFAYKRRGSWFFRRIYPEPPVSPLTNLACAEPSHMARLGAPPPMRRE